MAIATRYKGYRYPIEVLGHAVWLYHRFALSLRDVEELMLARGVAVTYRRPLSNLRKNRLAAAVLRCDWTRMSSTLPCWSTARHR